MSIGKVIKGTLAGLVLGAVAGVLFAPEKGSRVRKHVLNKGREYADKLKSRVDNGLDSLTTVLDKTERAADDLAARGREKYEEVKDGERSSIKM